MPKAPHLSGVKAQSQPRAADLYKTLGARRPVREYLPESKGDKA